MAPYLETKLLLCLLSKQQQQYLFRQLKYKSLRVKVQKIKLNASYPVMGKS